MTHDDTIRQFAKILRNMDTWIEKATAHAEAKKFEVDVLAQARLTPDQFSFAGQVQAACDQAKFAAAYLSGKPAPSHPDTERTMAELRSRIATCLEFVDSVTAADLAGGEERKVSPSWLGGKWLSGDDYLNHLAIPNFFFHATTAYALLRHNGVAVGKMDFIGSLPIQDA